MATTAFIFAGVEFVTNNHAAILNTADALRDYHPMQQFLAQSAIATALTAPARLSGSQIINFWRTGKYDNGGEDGSPSIVFSYEGEEYFVTPATVRTAFNLPELDTAYITNGDANLRTMMTDLGYSESLDKLGQLKRPGLRREWSFFFDCITRAFQKKSTNWDAIPMDMLQIGYSLIYSTNFDFGRLVLRNIGERMHENRQVIYFSRFCQLLFNATVGEVDFDVDDEIKPFRLHKRVFKDLISKDEKYPIQRPLLIPAQVRARMDMPPVHQQPQPQQPQPPVSPTISKQPRTSASKSKKAAKSDAAPSTAKRTRTSVATHVLKSNSEVPTNTDEPVNSEAHLNSDAPNSEIPENTEAATLPKQKRRRLVAAYDYDDLEPAHAVHSEPTPTTASVPAQASPQKPARFKRRAQKPARAKVPITEITDFTVEEDQTPSTPVAEHSQALMVLPIQAVPLTSPTASTSSSEVDEEIKCDEPVTTEAGANISDPHTPLSDHGPSTPIPNSPMKIPEGAIVHDTAPENYRSDVVDETDRVAMEALQSLAQTGEEPIKSQSEAQGKSAQDTVEKVADPIPETDKANSDADTDVDDSSDADKDENDGVPLTQQKWESTSQYTARLQTLTTDSEPLPRDLQVDPPNEVWDKLWLSHQHSLEPAKAEDFLSMAENKISNSDVMSSLKGTILYLKTFHPAHAQTSKSIDSLRTEVANIKETTDLEKKRTMLPLKENVQKLVTANESLDKRMTMIESNQEKMSKQLEAIQSSLSLITSILIPDEDDVKKGERVAQIKCKSTTQTLKRKKKDDDDDADDFTKHKRFQAGTGGRVPNSDSQKQSKQSTKSAPTHNFTSGSKQRPVIGSDKPMTDEELARLIFEQENPEANLDLELIAAEEAELKKEHIEAINSGKIQKPAKSTTKPKEKGILIKESTVADQSLPVKKVYSEDEYTSKGKSKVDEHLEKGWEKKKSTTSDKDQVVKEKKLEAAISDKAHVAEPQKERLTSDIAQVNKDAKKDTTSDKAQAVFKPTTTPLAGFAKPTLMTEISFEKGSIQPISYRKAGRDKGGLGSKYEKFDQSIGSRPDDPLSLCAPKTGVLQDKMDKLDSVQLVKNDRGDNILIYFMSDGTVFRVLEADLYAKHWEELRYVSYIFQVKNKSGHHISNLLKDQIRRKMGITGNKNAGPFIPKYLNHKGQLVEMKKNSAKIVTIAGIRTLAFNEESDKAYNIRLDRDLKKNKIYDLRAAIYQTGVSDPELREIKRQMITVLEEAERELLRGYLQTANGVYAAKE
ncbi:hypothetical protein ACET3Z_021608 [Daucus carota]